MLLHTRKTTNQFFASAIIITIVTLSLLTLVLMQTSNNTSKQNSNIVKGQGDQDQTTTSITRGMAGDLQADIVLGQPDFNQGIPKEIVSFKVAGPGGIVVDRSHQPNRVYVYDGINSRILGYRFLGVCENNRDQECSTDNDCSGSSCNIQVGGITGEKKADIVIGQPNFSSSACNGDGTFLHYPYRTEASKETLCSISPEEPSPYESGSFASMAVDKDGNLYVPDFFNNRILKYNSPFDEDTIADDVWGQEDFSGFSCNQRNTPSASTFCFEHGGPNYPSRPLTAGVDIDTSGNLWVADPGNNRVLRFSFKDGRIQHTADLVLGQENTSTRGFGNTLDKLHAPAAVRVDPDDSKVYVADPENNRVIVYNPADQTDGKLHNGQSGILFANNLQKPTGIEFDPIVSSDPNSGGIWVSDTNHNQLILFDKDANVKKVLFKDIYRDETTCRGYGSCNSSLGFNSCFMCDARGSIGITSMGDIIVSGSSAYQNVLLFKHPIPTPNEGTSYPAVASFYQPPSGHNYLSNKGMLAPRGIANTQTQLIVSDAGRIMFWNRPNSISDLINGKPADGVVGVPDFNTFNNPSYGRIAVDDKGNLWALRFEDHIERFTLPLHSGQMPDETVQARNFFTLGQTGTINRNDLVITGIAADHEGDHLWLSLPYNDRVLRVHIPTAENNRYVIDVIIGGRGNPYTVPQALRQWHRGCPSSQSLCSPGSVVKDKNGNLIISDYYLENEGSGRLIIFNKEQFPQNATTIITKQASDADHMINGFNAWQPGFDSNNRMVIGSAVFTNSYNGHPYVYNQLPNISSGSFVAQIEDHFTQAFAADFDTKDNLYITDMNRGRVLIYKTPFLNYSCSINLDPNIVVHGSIVQANIESTSLKNTRIDHLTAYYRKDTNDPWKALNSNSNASSTQECGTDIPREQCMIDCNMQTTCNGTIRWDTTNVDHGTYEVACTTSALSENTIYTHNCNALQRTENSNIDYCGPESRKHITVEHQSTTPTPSPRKTPTPTTEPITNPPRENPTPTKKTYPTSIIPKPTLCISQLCSKIPPTTKAMIQKADFDGDGTITIQDWLFAKMHYGEHLAKETNQEESINAEFTSLIITYFGNKTSP